MKKLSDYKDEEALELWGDLIEPMTRILADDSVQKSLNSGKAPFLIAKDILAAHKEDTVEILLRIDPTPLDGVNIIMRVVSVVLEFMNTPELKGFFKSAGQDKTGSESTGSVTANIKVVEA